MNRRKHRRNEPLTWRLSAKYPACLPLVPRGKRVVERLRRRLVREGLTEEIRCLLAEAQGLPAAAAR